MNQPALQQSCETTHSILTNLKGIFYIQIMLLLTTILIACFLLSCWIGYKQFFSLEVLNQRLIINSFLVVMAVLTAMTVLHWMEIFTQQLASGLTMAIYSAAAGFFLGYGTKLVTVRTKAGNVEYMYRSFWTDTAPNLIAIILVAFGVYRTGIIPFGPFTGIGITSGISLIAFGFWGYTIRVVPEFRGKGLLFLDQYVRWEKLVAYQWLEEETIEIDYLTAEGKLTSFSTFIPEEDRLYLERILAKKLKENEERREQQLQEAK